ncbi:hypothetical protein [Rhizobium mongolense]|uniref:hypothetical protein n=1 Tax=Rhizobium mongolense TaxID=57676 RepID=UPI001428D614|nr:hypothetical protein [Rhizobium mongolense]
MQQLAEDYVHLYTVVGAGNLLGARKQKIELMRASPVALVALQVGRIANAAPDLRR